MQVGDYARTKEGLIGKILRIETTKCKHIIIDYSVDDDFKETPEKLTEYFVSLIA